MEWKYFHAYRNLAEDGKVKFLQCPDCSSTLVTQPGPNEEPQLWCYTCDSAIKPGLDVYDQIRAVVKEHEIEEGES
jgi:hypothetical protein